MIFGGNFGAKASDLRKRSGGVSLDLRVEKLPDKLNIFGERYASFVVEMLVDFGNV